MVATYNSMPSGELEARAARPNFYSLDTKEKTTSAKV